MKIIVTYNTSSKQTNKLNIDARNLIYSFISLSIKYANINFPPTVLIVRSKKLTQFDIKST